ncbi:hypothetical protein C7S18_16395 [Ahniella affigens]|uniref:VCBS repeat-containing protein n=2 Tax=Ahniella affigens TaxID=2021234 RepID=A0A2P1PV04_9GAMM|nr:hypothetical protein C7S18_16395 [Ahniella affigens]
MLGFTAMPHPQRSTLISMILLVTTKVTLAQNPFQDESNARIPTDLNAGSTMDIAMADLDSDGDDDLVLAKEFRPNQFLQNDGQNRFSAIGGAFGDRVEDSEDIAIGDFDRDGDLDVVFVSEDTTGNEFYRNSGLGRFTFVAGVIPNNTNSNAVVAGDLDRDNDLDLVISRNTARELVLLNNGVGNFTDASNTWMPDVVDVTQDLKLIDIDNDQDLDLIAGNEAANGGRNRLYINTGTRFIDETSTRIPAAGYAEATRKVSFADVDRDSDIDLFFANADGSSTAYTAYRLLFNNGQGVFTDVTRDRLPAFRRLSMDAEFSDLDQDGDLDLVVADFQQNLQVLANDGTAHFTDASAAFLGNLVQPRSSIGVFLFESANTRYLFDAGYQDVDRLLVQSKAARLDSRYSGGFYNPAQNGHGFQFYVLEDQIALTWFTFDTDGSTRWVVAQGAIPEAGDDTAELQAFRGAGMVFGTFDPSQYQLQPWGTIRWRTIDCDHAEVRYESVVNGANGQPLGNGTIPVARLVRIPGLDCRSNPSG